MRKLSTLLLSLSLAAMPFSAFAFEAGEYTASAQGMDGPVTVTATFDESGITDVSVDVSGETAGIGAAGHGPAYSRYPLSHRPRRDCRDPGRIRDR